MPEELVRKEVFDARMDRMEALLEKTLMEMKADNEKLRSEVREGINGLRGKMRENIARLETRIEVGNARIDAVNMRIDGVQTTICWGFAIVAIVLAFLPTIQDWRKMFRKPPVTMEDVERAIAAAMGQSPQPVGLRKPSCLATTWRPRNLIASMQFGRCGVV
ncbi:MAG: hypothetical protein IJR68_02375 [Fretibacterium sp.]|nr:hypothetical protein [Fretibacterium sp.]